MTNVEKLKAYYGNKFNDEQIDEAVPRDILDKVKKRVASGRGQSYHQGSFISDIFPNTDLANSSVREITPQEADDEVKNGNFKNLIYTFGSDIVTLRQKEDGTITGSPHFATEVDTGGGNYKSTRKLRAKGIGKLADHIYFYDNIDKDPNLVKLRGENPESPNWTGYSDFDNSPEGRGSDAYEMSKHLSTVGSKDNFKKTNGWGSSIKDVENSIKNTEDRIAEYEARGGTAPDWMHKDLRRYKNELSSLINLRRDRLARVRNAAAEKDVNKNVIQYKNLKHELDSAQYEVSRAKRDLSVVQNSGSSTTRITRDRLNTYRERLNSILSEIARLEMQLDDAMESDSENIGKYQKQVDDAINKLNDIQSQVDSLLRR